MGNFLFSICPRILVINFLMFLSMTVSSIQAGDDKLNKPGGKMEEEANDDNAVIGGNVSDKGHRISKEYKVGVPKA